MRIQSFRVNGQRENRDNAYSMLLKHGYHKFRRSESNLSMLMDKEGMITLPTAFPLYLSISILLHLKNFVYQNYIDSTHHRND